MSITVSVTVLQHGQVVPYAEGTDPAHTQDATLGQPIGGDVEAGATGERYALPTDGPAVVMWLGQSALITAFASKKGHEPQGAGKGPVAGPVTGRLVGTPVWTSSDSSIATVTPNVDLRSAMVIAEAAGQCTVTLTVNSGPTYLEGVTVTIGSPS